MDCNHGFFLLIGLIIICVCVGNIYTATIGWLSFGGGIVVSVLISAILNKFGGN